ncbi:conserved hypothetical protein [Pseudoclavibacter sp. 8L]|nr:conserved hypothetical protein [Pseudoclavibacter sp. 8L]
MSESGRRRHGQEASERHLQKTDREAGAHPDLHHGVGAHARVPAEHARDRRRSRPRLPVERHPPARPA